MMINPAACCCLLERCHCSLFKTLSELMFFLKPYNTFFPAERISQITLLICMCYFPYRKHCAALRWPNICEYILPTVIYDAPAYTLRAYGSRNIVMKNQSRFIKPQGETNIFPIPYRHLHINLIFFSAVIKHCVKNQTIRLRSDSSS